MGKHRLHVKFREVAKFENLTIKSDLFYRLEDLARIDSFCCHAFILVPCLKKTYFGKTAGRTA